MKSPERKAIVRQEQMMWVNRLLKQTGQEKISLMYELRGRNLDAIEDLYSKIQTHTRELQGEIGQSIQQIDAQLSGQAGKPLEDTHTLFRNNIIKPMEASSRGLLAVAVKNHKGDLIINSEGKIVGIAAGTNKSWLKNVIGMSIKTDTVKKYANSETPIAVEKPLPVVVYSSEPGRLVNKASLTLVSGREHVQRMKKRGIKATYGREPIIVNPTAFWKRQDEVARRREVEKEQQKLNSMNGFQVIQFLAKDLWESAIVPAWYKGKQKIKTIESWFKKLKPSENRLPVEQTPFENQPIPQAV